MFYKITYSNGYCGCDEEEYIKTDLVGEDLLNYAEDYLISNYGFYEPDARFVDEEDYDNLDEYYAAVDDYQAECFFDIVECTEEEYLDNDGDEV